ncbi:recombinase zinc beta ribbon domain-containing protein [Paracoccus sphaerophysae]|uniref:recombinase zinc beta ribbon domain-containing protein n=1 Tax=Paracoccus sphaerophysae TaxID=690417 RepID=UPI00068FD22B|nr:recombinase zinc beta ribbon domain-containing protein [Paracoccus sphaerophysae]
MTCGWCCGGFSKVGKDNFGCSTARNKGAAICTNRMTIRRDDLESAVLNALEHHLMDPAAVELFCEEYAAERNRLRAEADAGRAELEKELRQVTRLVDAIIAGIPPEQVRDRMIALDTRGKELHRLLEDAPAPGPVRFHPSMAKTYRDRVAALIRGLGQSEGAEEAKEALRGLIDRIVLVPVETAEGASRLVIDLQGDLAGLLSLATSRRIAPATSTRNAKAPGGVAGAVDIVGELVLVAGARFQKYSPLYEAVSPAPRLLVA